MAAARPYTWFITGCSTGFGYELTKALLRRGEQVIATARNGPARLADLAKEGASVYDLDVEWSQEKIDAVVQEAAAAHNDRIDVLVNNAGIVDVGIMEDCPMDTFHRSLDINAWGGVRVMRAAMPFMREGGFGYNVYIGSVFGWTTVPGGGPYAASKFAIAGLAETMAPELEPFGIQTVIFEPGYFLTQVVSHDKLPKLPGSMPAYDSLRTKMDTAFAAIHGSQPGDATKAAETIVDVIRREGMAKGKGGKLPVRIPLGSDGAQMIRQKAQEMISIIDEWGHIVGNTDRDGFKASA